MRRKYKHVVSGPIFLKYISDAFEELHDYLRRAVDDPKDKYYLPPSTHNRRARALAMSALARYLAKPLCVGSGFFGGSDTSALIVFALRCSGIRIPAGDLARLHHSRRELTWMQHISQRCQHLRVRLSAA